MELLFLSAVTVGALHALAPDHWIPFVALARAQHWSKWKTSYSVLLAGLGHVSSSVAIGLIGILLGITTDHVNGWENIRGDVASLLLIGFGVAYLLYGLKQIGQRHTHTPGKATTISYWMLFIIIIFGPCEPLIPLLFASSAYGWMSVVITVGIFSAATIAMMQLQVHAALWGVSAFRWHRIEHASDAVAGVVILVTGIAIRVFGI